MLNKRLLLLILICAAVLAGVLWLVFARDENPQPIVRPSATPTASIQPTADLRAIKAYTEDFAARYYNYRRVDDPRYLERIKPFLEPRLYLRIAEESRKLGKRAKPIASTVRSVSVAQVSPNEVHARVALSVREAGVDPYQKVVTVVWSPRGKRWSVTRIKLESTTKKYPYLEE